MNRRAFMATLAGAAVAPKAKPSPRLIGRHYELVIWTDCAAAPDAERVLKVWKEWKEWKEMHAQ